MENFFHFHRFPGRVNLRKIDKKAATPLQVAAKQKGDPCGPPFPDWS
jgi:hypothetical protein